MGHGWPDAILVAMDARLEIDEVVLEEIAFEWADPIEERLSLFLFNR